MNQASVRSRLAERRAMGSGVTMISGDNVVLPATGRTRRSGRYGRANL
jgi:hypothetical protein